MASKLRIQYPGAMYHVMNRGDHQETIFCDEDDRKLFVATLAEGCEKTEFQIASFRQARAAELVCGLGAIPGRKAALRGGAAREMALRVRARGVGESQGRTPDRPGRRESR